jgi:hypothetical protein
MSDKRIEVTAYSGYRGDETPRSFIHGNCRIDVVEILGRRVEEEFHDGTRRRFFNVRGSDGQEYLIYFDYRKKHWFLRTAGNKISLEEKMGPT